MDKTDILVSKENRHFSRNSSNNNTSTITSSLLSNNNNRDAYDMNDLITDAQGTFSHLINTHVVKMLKDAKGVAFIKFCKGSSADFKGRGIVMKRNVADDEWGGPCAINVCGVASGVDSGVNEVCTVFVINDESFFSCLLQNNRNNDNTMAGNEFSITPGKLNEHNWLSSKIVSFSFAKGSFIDLPWEKIKISINNNVNHHYYQNEINPDVIFSGNIKSFDNQYFELSRRLVDTVNNSNVSSGQHFGQGKWHKQRYQFNMNAPLYQYYVENNKHTEYTLNQLKQLPEFPFLGDIRLQKYKLSNVKNWIIGNKTYRQFKDFIRAKRFSAKHDDMKTVEVTKYTCSEEAPLYQYYTNKKAVEYNAQQLRALPKFPFLYDVQHSFKYNFLTKINPMTWFQNYKDTNMNPTVLINDLKFKMQNRNNNNIPSQKYVFNEMSPLYQYYMHNENSKNVVYTCETLSKLPKLPFLNDITSNKIRFKQYNPVNIVKNFKVPKFLQRRRANKSLKGGFLFNDNIPMVQYYLKKNETSNITEGVYDHQQLDLLPKLPYLKDINSTKVKLATYNPVNFVKRLYKKYVGGNKQ